MIPKINIRYVRIYDTQFRTLYTALKKPYPPQHKIEDYTLKAQKAWKLYDKKIISEIPKLTNLAWQEQVIHVYIVGGTGLNSFSTPLTILYGYTEQRFVEVLVHELFHQNFHQGKNYSKAQKSWGWIKKTFSKDEVVTQQHTMIFAFLTKIYKKYFTEDRLQNEIARNQKNPAYKKAWDNVRSYGHEYLINEFTKKIK